MVSTFRARGEKGRREAARLCPMTGSISRPFLRVQGRGGQNAATGDDH